MSHRCIAHIALVAAGSLALVACGGDDASDSEDAAASPSSTVAATSAPVTTTASTDATLPPAAPPAGLSAWAEQLSGAWDVRAQEIRNNATIAVTAITTDRPRLEWTQEFYAAEVESADRLLAALPDEETGIDALDDALAAFRRAVTVARDAADAGRAIGDADPAGVAAELDEAGEPGLPETEYGGAYLSWSELDDGVATACFDLSDAMTGTGLSGLDCTGSGTDGEESDAAATPDDPTSAPTGLVFAGLPAGTHDFSVFEPGLVLATDRDLFVMTGEDHIEFRTAPESEAPGFVVIDPLVVDPSTMVEDPGLSEWIDLPEDVGRWIDALPVASTARSVTIAGDATDMWALDSAPDGAPFAAVMIYDGRPNTTDGGQFSLVPVAPFGTAYVAEWVRPEDRLVVYSFVETGDPEESIRLMEETLAGVIQP